MVTMSNTQLVNALVAALTKQVKVQNKKAVASKAKMTKEDFEVALIAACKKAGYGPAEPRFNVLTYDRWIEKGRKVKRGEHGIKVAGRKTRLFHEAQTEAISA